MTETITPQGITFQKFRIGFDPRDKKRVFDLWDDIFTSQKWTEGKYTQLFEEKWATWNGLPAVAFGSWAGGAMAALEFFNLRGKKVLVPTNTFMATPLSVIKSGGEVVFGDCNRTDLCLSFEAVRRAVEEQGVAAVWLVHIGGHIAFDTQRIAAFCKERGVILLEDCAHSHGASWNGKRPGSWGDAGIYSFYATKSISTGEGGMLVSRHPDLIDFARKYRNYGKFDHVVQGLNYRLSEFTAALGVVQVDRMDEITEWKNDVAQKHLDPLYSNRVRLPEGMTSGLYKYIIFEQIENSTGKVYDKLCHTILGVRGHFPNAEWIAQNHWCAPLYYTPETSI